ncbi:hypothetical protein RB195_022874 [Necator americanus]|uniref:Uncharacterized protein n=2 Tax=Necator americanus TaxID=51031 RepID=A0ABR1EHU8_NECAM
MMSLIIRFRTCSPQMYILGTPIEANLSNGRNRKQRAWKIKDTCNLSLQTPHHTTRYDLAKRLLKDKVREADYNSDHLDSRLCETTNSVACPSGGQRRQCHGNTHFNIAVTILAHEYDVLEQKTSGNVLHKSQKCNYEGIMHRCDQRAGAVSRAIRQMVIVGIDANAKIGLEQQSDVHRDIIQRERTLDNGDRLVDLCEQTSLIVTSTFNRNYRRYQLTRQGLTLLTPEEQRKLSSGVKRALKDEDSNFSSTTF